MLWEIIPQVRQFDKFRRRKLIPSNLALHTTTCGGIDFALWTTQRQDGPQCSDVELCHSLILGELLNNVVADPVLI